MPPQQPGGVVALLAAILREQPALRGAACAVAPRDYDTARPTEPHAEADQRHARAVARCRSCPALIACGEWREQLTAKQRSESGVVAAVAPTPKGRPNNSERQPK